MNSPQRTTEEPQNPASDPLRGVQKTAQKAKSTELEFSRLKNLVPSIAKKDSVSKLDVILEAIRYIDQLQDQLYEQVQERRLNPALAVNLLLNGKENTLNLNLSNVKSASKEESNSNLSQPGSHQ